MSVKGGERTCAGCTILADCVKTPCRNGNQHHSNRLILPRDWELRADDCRRTNLARRPRATEFSHGLLDLCPASGAGAVRKMIAWRASCHSCGIPAGGVLPADSPARRTMASAVRMDISLGVGLDSEGGTQSRDSLSEDRNPDAGRFASRRPLPYPAVARR